MPQPSLLNLMASFFCAVLLVIITHDTNTVTAVTSSDAVSTKTAFIPSSPSAFSIFPSPKRTILSNKKKQSHSSFCSAPQFLDSKQYDCSTRLNVASSKREGDDDAVQKTDDEASATATAERPSLHPITIEALSDVFLIRSNPSSSSSTPVIDIAACADEKSEVQPLDVALAAGKVAAEALDRHAADHNGGTVFTPEENQVVAGRVVGVVMRMRSLEDNLVLRVKKCVDNDNEEKDVVCEMFGILPNELNCIDDDNNQKEETEKEVSQKIQNDSKFTSRRAESLLAIFLHTIEEPTMKQMGQSLPGGSDVDFMEEGSKKKLFGEN